MTLYSKNGSIPYAHKDETEGWIEVEDAPVAGEGQEVVWWFPPGWVTRPVKPVKEGFDYSWSQSEQKWTEIIAQSVQLTEVNLSEVVIPITTTAIGVSLSGTETITGV